VVNQYSGVPRMKMEAMIDISAQGITVTIIQRTKSPDRNDQKSFCIESEISSVGRSRSRFHR